MIMTSCLRHHLHSSQLYCGFGANVAGKVVAGWTQQQPASQSWRPAGDLNCRAAQRCCCMGNKRGAGLGMQVLLPSGQTVCYRVTASSVDVMEAADVTAEI